MCHQPAMSKHLRVKRYTIIKYILMFGKTYQTVEIWVPHGIGSKINMWAGVQLLSGGIMRIEIGNNPL